MLLCIIVTFFGLLRSTFLRLFYRLFRLLALVLFFFAHNKLPKIVEDTTKLYTLSVAKQEKIQQNIPAVRGARICPGSLFTAPKDNRRSGLKAGAKKEKGKVISGAGKHSLKPKTGHQADTTE